ncbi:hypothetical protein [Actinoalloteichus spitiensis]|uniref:hypothetical protein n=1 Tax=Actinoalloteichus spitiensis TaxID=252394 RepID=UPI00036704C2
MRGVPGGEFGDEPAQVAIRVATSNTSFMVWLMSTTPRAAPGEPSDGGEDVPGRGDAGCGGGFVEEAPVDPRHGAALPGRGRGRDGPVVRDQ